MASSRTEVTMFALMSGLGLLATAGMYPFQRPCQGATQKKDDPEVVLSIECVKSELLSDAARNHRGLCGHVGLTALNHESQACGRGGLYRLAID